MDLLIKLYELPQADAEALPRKVRKPIGPEYDAVTAWVAQQFHAAWSSEARVALANRPPSLYIAVQREQLLGFACYDATARGFVGPIGVIDSARSQGIGRALLLACLHDMRAMGYGYAIAGHVGAPEFFRKTVGAIEIPDSTPGIYAGMLKA